MQDLIVARVPDVAEIHHVHIWGLTPQQLILTMHVTLCEPVASQSEVIRQVKGLLKAEYGIGHSTIEVDVDGCADHSN
jgi:cobalt-zinc-cadmium efflux system protein